MGFREVKSKVLTYLTQGSYDHEVRGKIDVKNLFQCGLITDEQVIGLIKQCRGSEYEVSPHHSAPSIDVHVLKPVKNGKRWYIKFYFLEPDVVFISVHESGV
ncbi:hypothetical protein [Rheinheimera salexigens]|uniref:Type II toxin-antitoxin system MqsR family toxin n=1 Tax=Rheinheimera salexigens TaxID=1628148 RepID=A0A1E7Q7R5_9GAMM|nr:hypothetical protein [Rheinheimera salexigens]OEY70209.1 hypothetical protein BI198_12020 [Rheinheimera salexigens]